MKIINLSAENVKKIKAVDITPKASVVQVTGPNGSGKSSVLDCIFYAIGGGKGLPSEPIRRGAKTARIQLDLGELVVTRRFTQNGSTLTVEGANGARFPSPQRMLDDLIGAISFDPLAFARMSAKEQFDMLKGIVKLDVDLDALAGANAKDYEERTDVNRRAKAARAQADGISIPSDLPADPVDVDALLAKMADAAKHNGDIERRKAGRETAQAKIAANLAEADRLAAQVEKLRAEARGLQEKIDTAEPLPSPIDTAEVRAQIDEAKRINSAIDQRRARDAHIATATDLEAKSDALTKAMDAREAAKAEAIAAAEMPIPDVGFGDSMVLYKGLPFDQASSAEQLRISIAIAMAANPKLRVLRVKDGSLLDESSMAILREMTEAADYQCWVETVHANGPVAVEMIDGAVKLAEAAE